MPRANVLETFSLQEAEGIRADLSTREQETHRDPSPVDSTTKDRSSALFDSSPSYRFESYEDETPTFVQQPAHLDDAPQSPSPRPISEVQPSTQNHASTVMSNLNQPPAEMENRGDAPPAEPYQSIFGPPPSQEVLERSLSPPKTPLQTIPEDDHEDEKSPALGRQRIPSLNTSSALGQRSRDRSLTPNWEGCSTPDIVPPPQKKLRRSSGSGEIGRSFSSSEHFDGPGRLLSPSRELERSVSPAISRSDLVSAAAGATGVVVGLATTVPQSGTRDNASDNDTKYLGNLELKPTTSQPQLRARQLNVESVPSSSTYDPINDKGKEVVRDMVDVYVSIRSLRVLPLLVWHASRC